MKNNMKSWKLKPSPEKHSIISGYANKQMNHLSLFNNHGIKEKTEN
jgi:hypothetical protein